MESFICRTCAMQFAESVTPPENCPVCDDERQYVGAEGQTWTTMAELAKTHHNVIRPMEPGLVGIGIEPSFAIGQRAMLIQTPKGNVLWDCIPLIDDNAVSTIQEMGGLSAIAISHPHSYSSMVEWSRKLGGVPIYVHGDDRHWVMRPDPAIRFWTGESDEILPDVTLVRCGGHFPGSSVLHWKDGAGGRGTLHTGDTIYVVPDRGWVSFMDSYPNLVPLSASEVRRIVRAVEPCAYDRIYGAWWQAVIPSGARDAVKRSAERYLRKISGTASTSGQASGDTARR